jgi:hypothetical protein
MMRVVPLVAALAGALALGTVAGAQLPAGLTYDDGYAWFQIETVKDTKDGKPYAKGWNLEAQLRIFGEVADHSAFKLVVKKDGNALATLRKEGYVYHYKPPAFDDMPSQMSDDAISDRNQVITGEGPFDIEVYFVKGDDSSEHLARTHRIDVRKVTRVRGALNEPDAPEFYINRHGEAAVAVIHQRPKSQDPYIAEDRATTYSYNVIDVFFGTSATQDGLNLDVGYLRSTVNGQPLDLSSIQNNNKDKVSGDVANDRYYQVVHTAAGNVKEAVDFRQYNVVLPLTFGKADDPARSRIHPSISDHPGNWEIAYIVNGAPVRTWRFVVGEDGNIAAHPEEATGPTLGPGAHLAEMVIPDGGTYIDERLVPDQAKVGGLYGHAWQSAEMKAAAAAMPAKGTPWP